MMMFLVLGLGVASGLLHVPGVDSFVIDVAGHVDLLLPLWVFFLFLPLLPFFLLLFFLSFLVDY